MPLTLFRRNSPTQSTTPTPQSLIAATLRSRDGERLRRYQELLDFYQGIHFPTRRRGRTNLVVNYARAVVDKGVSYLFGRGVHISVPSSEFRVQSGARNPRLPERGTLNSELAESSELAERLLGAIAEENELELVLLQAATNASVLGDAFLKVFWDPAAQRVRIINVDPFRVFPTWAADDLSRLRELALVSRVSSLESRVSGGLDSRLETRDSRLETLVEVWTPDSFRTMVGSQTLHEGPNPYGFIPFVHVANLQPPNSAWGVSDLLDLIPLNRELDERISDQADVIRYHADPPVVFKGVEEHSDLPVGPGTVWDLPRDADVSLLEWRGSGPSIQEHIERVLRALYEVTETPRTSFGDSGRLLSGVALETELQPLIQRTHRKRVIWSAALRRCSRMVLLLAERFSPGYQAGAFAPYRARIVWPPLLPADDDAEARRNLALVEGGLRSHRTGMAALGELDPETELRRIRDDRRVLEEEG